VDLTPYLQDLEERINPDEEDRLLAVWRDFANGVLPLSYLDANRSQTNPPGLVWPSVRINAALDDYDLMAFQQYGACSAELAKSSGSLLNVRCNYGTAILPSLFGAALFVMDDALNTLPTCWPLAPDALQRVLDTGVPNIRTGYGGRVLEMAERFAEIALRYPKIGRYVHIYHPDLQGPMDACELLWGSSIFVALYDRPDEVVALLELVTETYTCLMRAWAAIIPFDPRGSVHWGMYHRGALMLRDDSAMNLSAAMFRCFVQPYDQRLLDEFGGGAIHFCGKGDHFIQPMSELRGLYAVNLSQPELNDMEKVFTFTVDRGIDLIGLSWPAVESALARRRDLHCRVHVVH
jgi:hypothetical protein